MKKIMISLLMVAATMSAMAATVAGQAKITIKGVETGKSCVLTIAELSDGVDGLNSGYYAELNEEGKDVQMYVVYGGKKYQTFGSNAATMADLQLGIKTDASTSYTLTASGLKGNTLKIQINGVDYTITSSLNETITTLTPSTTNDNIGKVQPTAAAQEFCFKYEKLTVNAYAGKTLKISKDGTDVVAEFTLGDTYEYDFSAAAAGRYVVTFDGKEYQIDVKPAVTVVP